MDNIIQFVTILFMLSMIFERVSEFFKNYLSCKKIGNKFWVGDTTTKFPAGSPQELRRDYRILKMNLVIGFVTAFLCHASLFDILRHIENPGQVIGWPEKLSLQDLKWNEWFNYIGFLLGCFFTGAFISMGSKFWHDLLDILVEVKNAKRSVAALGSAADFSTLSREDQFQLMTDAIRQNEETWRNSFSNYEGVSIANKLSGPDQQNTGLLSLRFNVTEKQDLPPGQMNRIPTFIFYKGYRLPTDILETGKATASSTVIDPAKMPRPLGCSVGRDETQTAGTVGLRARIITGGETKVCAISCYHVVFPEELRKQRFSISSGDDPQIVGSHILLSPTIQEANVQNNVGSVLRGEFSKFLDIGFFETSNSKIDDSVFELGAVKNIYDVNPDDESRQTSVRIYGRSSGHLEGSIFAATVNKPVAYFSETTKDAFIQHFEGLIQLKMPADHGDSGAAVLTETNELVGILIAIDHTYSYVLPARRLLKNFPVTLDINEQ
ncbi:MAG TPA: hypothetical protein VNR87_13405 [Flavisolibacter sp.]|nr:hypothetical protein [Flavisolibacter sp.]